jgi:hypothetical protein
VIAHTGVLVIVRHLFGNGSNSGKEIKITMYWNISQHLSFQVREQEPARTKTKITRTGVLQSGMSVICAIGHLLTNNNYLQKDVEYKT